MARRSLFEAVRTLTVNECSVHAFLLSCPTLAEKIYGSRDCTLQLYSLSRTCSGSSDAGCISRLDLKQSHRVLLYFKCESNLLACGLLCHPPKVFIRYGTFLIILQEFVFHRAQGGLM